MEAVLASAGEPETGEVVIVLVALTHPAGRCEPGASGRRSAAAGLRPDWPTVILAALEDAGFSTVERNVALGIFSEYIAVR